MSDELIRAEFEKIISKASLSRGKYLRQDYDSAATQFAWEMWQKCWPIAFAAGLESRPTPEQSGEALELATWRAWAIGVNEEMSQVMRTQEGLARDAARYQMCEDLCMYFTDTMGDRIGISLPIPDHPPMKSTAEVFRWVIDAAMDRSALGLEG